MANLDRTKQTNEIDRLISMLETRLNKVENSSISKKYKATMNQSGANAPTVVVLGNTVGEISWVYSAIGTYLCKSNGLFTDKTYIPAQMRNYVDSEGDVFKLERTDDSTLTLTTESGGVKANNLMQDFQLEFEVY